MLGQGCMIVLNVTWKTTMAQSRLGVCSLLYFNSSYSFVYLLPRQSYQLFHFVFSTTEISQFLLTMRDGIPVDKSPVSKRPDLGSRVQSITLNWTPKQNDLGKHLVCSFIVDTLGYD